MSGREHAGKARAGEILKKKKKAALRPLLNDNPDFRKLI
jgi:hypothetical protein